jgi:hypothetical protein
VSLGRTGESESCGSFGGYSLSRDCPLCRCSNFFFSCRFLPASQAPGGPRAVLASAPGAIRREFVANRSAPTTEIAAGAYTSLGVTFLSLVSPSIQAAAFVSGDGLYRIGHYSVAALGNALQGWAVENERSEFARRARTAVVLHLTLGLIGLGAFALLGPWPSGACSGQMLRWTHGPLWV